jgi:hypothetical protein
MACPSARRKEVLQYKIDSLWEGCSVTDILSWQNDRLTKWQET